MTNRTTRVGRDELVSRQEAADILQIHPNLIDKMGRERILRRYRIKGIRRIFYLKDDVENCIVELADDEELDDTGSWEEQS